MNGEELAKLRSMDDGEWRGYLAGKLEGVEKAIASHGKSLKSLFKLHNDLSLEVGKIPPHCLHTDTVKKLDMRIDDLEKTDVGRKAVNKAVFGASGFSVIGIIILLLKIFKVL
jgi:hypothetical protein